MWFIQNVKNSQRLQINLLLVKMINPLYFNTSDNESFVTVKKTQKIARIQGTKGFFVQHGTLQDKQIHRYVNATPINIRKSERKSPNTPDST